MKKILLGFYLVVIFSVFAFPVLAANGPSHREMPHWCRVLYSNIKWDMNNSDYHWVSDLYDNGDRTIDTRDLYAFGQIMYDNSACRERLQRYPQELN